MNKVTAEDLMFASSIRLQNEHEEYAKVTNVEQIPKDLINTYYENLIKELANDERVEGKDVDNFRVEEQYVEAIEKQYGITLVAEGEDWA